MCIMSGVINILAYIFQISGEINQEGVAIEVLGELLGCCEGLDGEEQIDAELQQRQSYIWYRTSLALWVLHLLL